MFDFIKQMFTKDQGKTDHEHDRLKITDGEAKNNVHIASPSTVSTPSTQKNFIVCNGKQVEINSKVVQRPLPTNCWTKTKTKTARVPSMLVTHWDVALSADRCFSILKNIKISTHFCIDNDGTIYQFVDTNDVAWHAGPTTRDRELWKGKKLPSWNSMSIGIDFSNAYYEKYQKNYVAAGFEPRPVITSKVNNSRLGPHLGFYPKQIEAYKELVRVLCAQYNIPLECPEPLEWTSEQAALGNFTGVVNHYNLTRNKIDCAGLPLKQILKEIKEIV
jgi:hypothetical protein